MSKTDTKYRLSHRPSNSSASAHHRGHFIMASERSQVRPVDAGRFSPRRFFGVPDRCSLETDEWKLVRADISPTAEGWQ